MTKIRIIFGGKWLQYAANNFSSPHPPKKKSAFSKL